MIQGDVRFRWFLLPLAGALMVLAGPAAAGPWSGGLHAGVSSRTAGGDVFTFGGHLAHEFTTTFSAGPTVWIAPGDPFSEWGVAAEARVRWDLEDLGYPPFSVIGLAGLGYLDAHADASDALPPDDDFSLYIPIGMGLQYTVGGHVALAGTVELRFHGIEVQDREDEASFGFLFGLEWLP